MAYFRKSKSLYSSTLSGSISTGTGETITPSSVAGLPTDTEITLTFDRVDANGNATPSKLERITGTISGGNLINYVRGQDSTTEQAHSAGAIIEAIWSAKDWNDAISGILTSLDQDGNLKSGVLLTAPKISGAILDVYGNEALLLSAAVSNAANYAKISSAALSGYPVIEAAGDDTNIKLRLLGKGTGTVQFYSPTASAYYDLLPTSTSGTLTENSDSYLATQKAVKTYVDAKPTPPTDGWTSSSDTWVYASASTFTIAGVDRTAVYRKGTRLKFDQSGTKYAVVVSSTFSTNTTVTIAVNTDYTIANAAISSPYYSYALSPQGYPAWFNFTTTWSGFTASTPTYTFRYVINGNICYYQLYCTGNGTSNATSLTYTLPVAAAVAIEITGANGADNGSAFSTTGVIRYSASSATAEASKQNDRNYSGWTNANGKSINVAQQYLF